MATAVLLATSITFVGGAQAQTEETPSPEPETAVDFSWDVAEYDRVLAATPPEDDIKLGDMLFRRATVQGYRDRLAGADSTQGAGVGTAKWTGGNVFYAFDANITATQRQQFLDVTKEWSAFAKLTFTPRTTQANYIRVVQPATGGCNSYVGMIGGAQALNLDPGCWVRTVIIHELGHALGFHHEHQRSDRDNYVTINFQNIADQDPAHNWWARIPDTTNWSGYDFLSIMHYSRNGGSKSPDLDVIVPKPGYTQYIDEIGRQPGLSRLDRAAAATAYGLPVPAPSAVVTNTQDSGPGTLRTALYYASDRTEGTPASTTTVQFRIPTTDPGFADTVFTIKPRAALIVGGGTTIDGASQTSFTGNTNTAGPEVVLNGSLAPPTEFASGLLMKGVNSSVRSMVINGFPDAGITIKRPTATRNSVLGNYIGTDKTGTAAVFNAHTGVRIVEGAHGNTIGGAAVADRNVISGNHDYGVSIGGTGTNSNVVSGNLIGVNRTGSAALPNQFSGIAITEGARLNQIGGAVAGAGNVVSGNSHNGIAMWGAGTSNNVVRGNLVGVNAAGTARIANTFAGVSISGGAQSNTIGGVSASERNVISGNTNQGVSIGEAGTNGNIVRGNYIGTNVAGTGAIPNGAGVLIWIGARSNLIGGTSAGAGNVISGNNNQGVAISGAGTNSNRVEGNRIGTNAAGTGALGNTWAGAAVFDGAQSNAIGGSVAGAGNTISGGKNHGVHLGGATTKFNLLQGNRIGTNAAGTSALPNALSGVEVAGAASNTIGGTASGARNFVAGNTQYGLILSSPGTTGNVIQGNNIGLLPTGYAGPNGAGGMILANGAAGNQIGGTAAGAGNRISRNTGAGLALDGASTTGNAIRGNVFSSNTGLGIDLWPGGVTLNDAGDGDTGPNRLQNYPVLTSAVNGTSTVVRGTLSSVPSTTFRIEFFSSPGADPTLYGEGANYLGSTSATTNAAGNTSVFAFTTPAMVPAGQVITATATDPSGNTSEFSQRVVVG